MANMTNNSFFENVIKRKPFGWTYMDRASAGYHFPFEEIDPFYWQNIISEYRNVVYYVGALYIVTIFGLQSWMKGKPAYHLKGPLFWWNLGLGVFSIIGFVRTIPGFLYVLNLPGGFYSSICKKEHADVPFGFWCLMFIFSKYIELGDTIFIVLRKRPLIILQWFHHVVTMTVVWILAPYMEPVTRWYTVLNYGVHSAMYNYFAMKAIGVKVPSWIANIITTLQLAQMFIGMGVNLASMYYFQSGHDCFRHPESIKAFSLVYGSFLILFGKLFYESVVKSGRAKKDQMEKKID